jgi:hypothetical protein
MTHGKIVKAKMEYKKKSKRDAKKERKKSLLKSSEMLMLLCVEWRKKTSGWQ